MSFNYAKTADTSLKLLTKFGRTVTRRTYTTGTYNPATGSATPATADTTRIGALLELSKTVEHLRGELIAKGDKKLLLDAEGAADIKDHYIIGGIEYTVMSIAETNPAGTPVLYELHLRLA